MHLGSYCSITALIECFLNIMNIRILFSPTLLSFHTSHIMCRSYNKLAVTTTLCTTVDQRRHMQVCLYVRYSCCNIAHQPMHDRHVPSKPSKKRSRWIRMLLCFDQALPNASPCAIRRHGHDRQPGKKPKSMLLVTWLSTMGKQGLHVINCVYTVGVCRAGWDCAFGV